MRDAKVDESSLLRATDDVDGKAQRAFGLRQEFARVLRDTEGVRGDGTHGRRMKTGEPLAKPREARQRCFLRSCLDAALRIQSGAEAQSLAPGVETIDLIAFDATLRFGSGLDAQEIGRAHV